MKSVWTCLIIDDNACDALNVDNLTYQPGILSAPRIMMKAYSEMLSTPPSTNVFHDQSTMKEIEEIIHSHGIEQLSVTSKAIYMKVDGMTADKLRVVGKDLVNNIIERLNIVVSIGFGHTRMLATVAAYYGVQEEAYKHVVYLFDDKQIDNVLKKVSIRTLHAIAPMYQRLLRDNGIKTVFDLKVSTGDWVRNQFGSAVLAIHEQIQSKPSRFLCNSIGLHKSKRLNSESQLELFENSKDSHYKSVVMDVEWDSLPEVYSRL